MHLAFSKALDADLRTLQIAEHGDPLADLLGHLAHHLHALRVRRRLAMREVHAHDVRARAQHLGEHFGVVGRGTERGENLGATEHRR